MTKGKEAKIEAAEMWFYRQMLRQPCKDNVTNKEVLALIHYRTFQQQHLLNAVKYLGYPKRFG